MFGGEAILSGGKPVGQTTSGNYGYSIGKSLVLGYVPLAAIAADDFEVEAFGERSKATIVRGAAYDPERAKILC